MVFILISFFDKSIYMANVLIQLILHPITVYCHCQEILVQIHSFCLHKIITARKLFLSAQLVKIHVDS